MKRSVAGVWLLGALLLGGALWWSGRPGRSLGGLPVLSVPQTLEPRSRCFVQLLDPRVGDPARRGELELALQSCLDEAPDFAIVTGSCTVGPQHLELFRALLDASGLPAFWLPGPLDAASPSTFSPEQLAGFAALRVLHYGPLRLVGVNSTLFLPAALSEPARVDFAERVFERLRRELQDDSGPEQATLFFHGTSLQSGVWDARFAAPWQALQAAHASFLCLDGQTGDSLRYRLDAAFSGDPGAGIAPGWVLAAGTHDGPRPVWRLFRLSSDGRGIACQERAADGRLLGEPVHFALPLTQCGPGGKRET